MTARDRDHLVDDVLGWWAQHGPDEERGGVFTCWDNAGDQLISTDKYTWSQGRWAWLTARVARDAQLLGIDGEPWARWSEQTVRFMADHAVSKDLGTAYVTDAAGVVAAPQDEAHASVFADLFAALGFAGAASLHGRQWADLALSMLRTAAASIAAGPVPTAPYPVPAGHRSLGLPMILIGVGEQVFRATDAPEAAAIVSDAAQVLTDHFVDGADVAEMPAPEHPDRLLHRHRTPGHVLELAWFAYAARDLIDGPLGRPEVLADISRTAFDLGWDEQHGGLLRFTDAGGGKPRGQLLDSPQETMVTDTWDTKLWWPHSEGMYTTRLLADACGDRGLAERHQRLRDYTMATFPQGPGREWTQIRNRDGTPLNETVALPVKDPFHIARSLLLLIEHEHANARGE